MLRMAITVFIVIRVHEGRNNKMKAENGVCKKEKLLW